ncbi:MAG: LamG domain-containing protein [bacterium]|nr:LamG domain-containing protein [bacterium]
MKVVKRMLNMFVRIRRIQVPQVVSRLLLPMVLIVFSVEPSLAQMNALALDGWRDWVIVPDNPSLDISDELTVEAWIYLENLLEPPTLDNYWIVAKWYGSPIAGTFIFHVSSSGRLALYLANTDASYIAECFYGLSVLEEGRWYHCAFTFSNSSVELYVDGNPDGSANTPFSNLTTDEYVYDDYYIGDFWNVRPGVEEHCFKGIIDDVRIWSVCRTQEEIASGMYAEISGDEVGLRGYWKFNESSGVIAGDSSLFGNHGTLAGDASFIPSTSPVNRPHPTNIIISPEEPFSNAVTIQYDLYHGLNLPMSISMQVSADDGVSWDIPVNDVHGDVGQNILPGMGYRIIWNAGSDWPGEMSEMMKIRVLADDGR